MVVLPTDILLALPLAVVPSSFPDCVLHVVCYGPSEEMVRAYAQGNITLVADVDVGWLLPVKLLEDESLGRYAVAIEPEPSISLACVGCPQPAALGLVDVLPEPGDGVF